MAGSREAAYRALAEQAVEAQARTAAGMEQLRAEVRRASAFTEYKQSMKSLEGDRMTRPPFGFIAAAIATIRAGAWADWRRLTPLAVGIWMAALLALALTKALPTGIAIWGLSLLAFCLALHTGPARVETTRTPQAAGGQAA